SDLSSPISSPHPPPPPPPSPLPLHDALPIPDTGLGTVPGDARQRRRGSPVVTRRAMLKAALAYVGAGWPVVPGATPYGLTRRRRSEEHTSELQSLTNLVCRLLLEKKKTQTHP